MTSATDLNVVIVGAGVIGLTTALTLAPYGRWKITVVAKHMPGDCDIEYASPWAGADYLPVGKPGSKLAQFERDTWPELQRLASNVPEAGIHFQDTVIYNRQKDVGSATGDWFSELVKADPWYKDVFRNLPKNELPKGVDSGSGFTSVCINTPMYLSWLVGRCASYGVVVKRGIVKHIADAAKLHHSGKAADIVVNCTGLSAATLGGVEDKAVYPARGQIVLVRNDPKIIATVSGTDDGSDEATYVMHRAAGGGCILGGCLQKNNWESQPDPNLAIRIMKRCVELVPALTDGKGIEALSIIRHGVGLRPMRKHGPRVEKEKISGIWVVHQYGHGGYGYQSSYGSAKAAAWLVEEVAMEVAKERARL